MSDPPPDPAEAPAREVEPLAESHVIPPVGLRRGAGGRYDGQFRPEFSRVHLDADLLWITPLPVRYVLVVVGRRWAGKGTIVGYLQEKRGFAAHNLQRFVRHEAERQGRSVASRAVRQQIGDALRAEHLPARTARDQAQDGDPAYLARRALRRIRDRYSEHGRSLEPPRRIVIGGLCHSAELEAFMELGRCHVLRACCPDDDRRDRADRRGLLSRDMAAYRAAEFPGAREVNTNDPAAVFALVDGYDADGSAAAQWAATCAHGVAGLMEEVERRGARQEGDPGDAKPTNIVFDVQTSESMTVKGVYDRLDEVVDTLDQQYLVRTT